jgi:hypothetical protein
MTTKIGARPPLEVNFPTNLQATTDLHGVTKTIS